MHTFAYMGANLNRFGQTHDQLQASCFRWACNAYHPFIFRHLIAIPNEMHIGNVVRWKQYEAVGVTPGVWDMQFNWIEQSNSFMNIAYPATHWFEFKVGKDKLSTAQIKFKQAMTPLGHKFYVISEEEEFQAKFKSIVEPTLDFVKTIYGANESNIKIN